MLDGLAAQRSSECVERWPECESGAYDPRCCRFPKSCSCNVRPEETAAITYRCQHCGKPVTVGHAAAWPSQCPHCKTAPPTLVMKVPNG